MLTLKLRKQQKHNHETSIEKFVKLEEENTIHVIIQLRNTAVYDFICGNYCKVIVTNELINPETQFYLSLYSSILKMIDETHKSILFDVSIHAYENHNNYFLK